MLKKLSLENIEEFCYTSSSQNFSTDLANTQELELDVDNSYFHGNFKRLITEDFKINFGTNCLKQPTSLFFDLEGESIEMNFILEGSGETNIDGLSQQFTIENYTHNIYYTNTAKGQLNWHSTSFRFLEIHISSGLFLKFLPEGKTFTNFKRLISQKRHAALCKNNFPITQKMYTIIREIIRCPYKNHFRHLFLQSKVLELLLLQFDQVQQYEKVHTERLPDPPKLIVEKMHYARHIALENLNKPLCLSSLAKEVHTNECTLKKEFKNVFGTTVFGCIRDAQMNRAKEYLEHRELSISQISSKIGYKNPQHFTTAFKRKFGITPSAYKNNL